MEILLPYHQDFTRVFQVTTKIKVGLWIMTILKTTSKPFLNSKTVRICKVNVKRAVEITARTLSNDSLTDKRHNPRIEAISKVG